MVYVLNGAILIAYFAELYNDYIKIFEENLKSKEKRRYIVRAIVMFILAFSALMILYHTFGMDGIDLEYFLRYGKIR
jgi:heme/copper-type cytochrome/quinol oxidase subunit 1